MAKREAKVPASATVRVNWTLKAGAKEIVEAAGANWGQSAYVSEVIEQRDAAWRAALAHLRERGWRIDKVRRLVELVPRPLPFEGAVARGVSAAVGEVVSEADARALTEIARELAAGNEATVAAIF